MFGRGWLLPCVRYPLQDEPSRLLDDERDAILADSSRVPTDCGELSQDCLVGRGAAVQPESFLNHDPVQALTECGEALFSVSYAPCEQRLKLV